MCFPGRLRVHSRPFGIHLETGTPNPGPSIRHRQWQKHEGPQGHHVFFPARSGRFEHAIFRPAFRRANPLCYWGKKKMMQHCDRPARKSCQFVCWLIAHSPLQRRQVAARPDSSHQPSCAPTQGFDQCAICTKTCDDRERPQAVG